MSLYTHVHAHAYTEGWVDKEVLSRYLTPSTKKPRQGTCGDLDVKTFPSDCIRAFHFAVE